MIEKYKEEKDRDFVEVTKASFRLISLLEEIIHYSKKTSSFESFEPNYEEISQELSFVINEFKEGIMKKRVIPEMLNTTEE